MRLFARARDEAGVDRAQLVLPSGSATVSDVRRALVTRCPQLAGSASRLLVAVNQAYARDEDVVRAGDEVAFFPPVSGG